MFSRYYQSELAYLREMGRSFALANPSIAPLLAERSGDPDVERLLEGFAFLTARIRERADEAAPEVIQGLSELLLPHYLRPIPACSIVEFTPQLRALRGALRVAQGTEIAAKPIEGTSCLFTTTADLVLLPISIVEASVEYPSSTSPVIRVVLQAGEQGRAELRKLGALRLYLHGDISLSSALYLWLSRHCSGVEVSDATPGSPSARLPANALRPLGFDPSEALFPWPKLIHHGFRWVQEFFTMPEKFFFFELTGWERVPVGTERFEIRFQFDRPPALPSRVARDAFRLHCVPAANLFSVDAEPMRFDAIEQEHLVRASSLNPSHMEVYSVEGVEGSRLGGAQGEKYPPFIDFTHSGQAPIFYRTRRAPSPVDEGFDTYLALSSPRDVPPSLAESTVSVKLICTNRTLTSQLMIGDLSVPTSSSPTLARFANVLAVTKPIRPPLGSELHWRVLSHLALNHHSLANAQSLKAILALYNFQAQGDHPVGQANELRLNAIRRLSPKASRRFLQGTAVRGTRTTLELEETGFAGPGDMFLFGSVLDELLATQLSLNSFHELAIQFFPSKREYTWPPRSGTQPLI